MLLKRTKKLLSLWKDIPEIPKDQILYYNQLYGLDKNIKKINLTIGAYKDKNAEFWDLPSVLAAEKIVNKTQTNDYLPLLGDEEFTDLACELAYGRENNKFAGVYEKKEVVKAQCLSGAGGLFLFFNILRDFYNPPKKNEKDKIKVYISNPTWPNHFHMAELQGFKPVYYEYYDLEKREFNYNKFINSIKNIPEYSPIILHAVGHNPTGFDPNKEQWKEILEIVKNNKLLVCFDMAYQGFVSGSTEEDAYAIRLFARHSVPMVVIQSFSKNFGLYGQRVGCISIPKLSSSDFQFINKKGEVETKHFEFVENLNEYLASKTRQLYSGSARYGSDLIKTILKNSELKEQWKNDLLTMSSRMIEMRELLYKELIKLNPKDDWSYITKQKGMFAFTHLTPENVKILREKYSVYMLENGRISICGLTRDNCEYMAKAVYEVTNN